MDESSNPVLSDKVMKRLVSEEHAGVMTVSGSVAKTAFALVVVFLSAMFAWSAFASVSTGWLVGISIATFVMGLITVFKANAFTVSVYAVLEGLLLGVVSRFMETAYNGIVLQAILLTAATTLAMLVLYSTGAVAVTKKARSIILIATVGVLIYFVFEMLVAVFNPAFLSILTSGPWGIAIAAVIVFIAALNLLLDFNFISEGAAQKLPKKAEWYAAFGLTVTLIWLYVSIVRLLAATRR